MHVFVDDKKFLLDDLSDEKSNEEIFFKSFLRFIYFHTNFQGNSLNYSAHIVQNNKLRALGSIL